MLQYQRTSFRSQFSSFSCYFMGSRDPRRLSWLYSSPLPTEPSPSLCLVTFSIVSVFSVSITLFISLCICICVYSYASAVCMEVERQSAGVNFLLTVWVPEIELSLDHQTCWQVPSPTYPSCQPFLYFWHLGSGMSWVLWSCLCEVLSTFVGVYLFLLIWEIFSCNFTEWVVWAINFILTPFSLLWILRFSWYLSVCVTILSLSSIPEISLLLHRVCRCFLPLIWFDLIGSLVFRISGWFFFSFSISLLNFSFTS